MTDSEQLRLAYEGVVKQTPSNVEAVHYLAVWHLERHSFQQVFSEKSRRKQEEKIVTNVSYHNRRESTSATWQHCDMAMLMCGFP
jgi:hypothetical protein